MTAKTTAELKREQRERDRAAGLTEVNIKIHKDDVADLRSYARELNGRRNADLFNAGRELNKEVTKQALNYSGAPKDK